MTCLDYEHAWDARLDARLGAAPPLSPAMAAHEASCEPCRALGLRQRTLLRALAAMGPPPAPPAGFLGRFRAETPAILPIARPRPWRYAVAAAVLLAGLLAIRGARLRPEIPTEPPARPLSESLADATSATLDLARAATGPAARVGRGAWGAVPSKGVEDAAADPGPGVLRGVGDRVGEGVRPLSGSARNAFGFLFDPVLAGGRGRDGV